MGTDVTKTKTMRPGRGHIFDNTRVLQEMLHLRFVASSGPSALGRLYGVDHSTIIYHCRRNQSIVSVIGGEIMVGRPVPVPIVAPDPWIDENGEKLNPGRNYAEYVMERARRKKEAVFSKLTKDQRDSLCG